MSQEKYRHEFKYFISYAQLIQLQQRLKTVAYPDSHADVDGKYHIRSVYFDDLYNSCYLENIAGTDPREKFRIRIYNCSSSRITLECKRKERGKTLKTSCPLTMEEFARLMQGHPLENIESQPPVLRKLTLLMLQRGMHPATIVDYERIPYVYPLGNVRITLDTNISSSDCFSDFFSPELQVRSVLPAGQHLLEVKFDEYLPDTLYHALQMDYLQPTAFSKYAMCRRYTL